MPFASALSEHPVASQAIGEVSGAVLETLGERPDLVVLTTSAAHAGALEDMVTTVAAALHPLAIVGCSAEAVVGTGKELEGTPAVSLWAGQVGPLAVVELGGTRLSDDSWRFGGWPVHIGFEPAALVLVADPFTFPADEFLTWLAGVQPGLAVIGGNASGGRGPGGTRLVVGDRVARSGAAGVLIGAGVDIETVVSQGCEAYGRVLTVTRSDRNVIYEVAGMPAMECMVDEIEDSLDPVDVAGIEANGLYLGRLIDHRIGEPGPGDFLVRSVVGMDRSTGAIAVDDRVPLGSTVRFHRRDAGTAHRDLDSLLRGRQAGGAVMFTCNGRGVGLFEEAHHDATLVSGSIGPVPVGGFFAAGEFGPVGGHNFVHGLSASIALLRDR